MTELSPHLSIGEVLGLLQQDFPDVTISKIRFLESQGLIDPERTPSGYRKFYDLDIERLRWILHQQRENFLPLKVIKDRLENGGPLSEQPPETEELVDVAVGPEGIDTEQAEPERDSGLPVVADAVVEQAGTPSWQDDPTMEFDFAALSAEVAASGHLVPEETLPSVLTTTEHLVADDRPVADGAIDHELVDQAVVSESDPDSDSTQGASELPIDEVPIVDEAASAAAPPAVGATEPTPPQDTGDAAKEAGKMVEPEQPAAAEQANGWGVSDLDRALATTTPTSETALPADVDLVELEGGTTDTGGDDTVANTDTESESDAASVTERLRRGDLGEADNADSAEPADVSVATAEAESAPEPTESDSTIVGGSEAVRRPAVERYFSSDYREPLGAMAMTVEELASTASLTVSQIRELEHFGIIVGESVGPDVIYDEENLAVAQAASTFLERGIEPRHLRQFAMAADREVSLYEQLALPVIRRRDPATRTEADKLLGALYESGTELRSLLVKRGIRSTFGR